jgi:hypothetical protein
VGARHRSALDPDEAWDARVGHEADYPGYYEEETELQSHHVDDGRYEDLQHGSTEYTGAAGEGAARGRMPMENPFSDDAAVGSLRSVSPRPLGHGDHETGKSTEHHSPTRRSFFKEDV